MPRKIYIASSWRNQHHNSVVRACRGMGHEVYDFKNPQGGTGFSWDLLDLNWQTWTTAQYVAQLLDNPLADIGFASDMNGLNWCDTCILLLPCGNSAHLEAGYAIGQKKQTAIFVANEKFQPDLMYKMADLVTEKIEKIYAWLGE